MNFVPNDPPLKYRDCGRGLRQRIPMTAVDAQQWAPGSVFSEGFVQRFIHDLHSGFEDDERIADEPHVLVEARVGSIPETEWEIDDEKAGRYAALATPFPPVVLTASLGFVDGGHRYRAACLRGDQTIRALVPATLAKSQTAPLSGVISLRE